MNKMSVFHVLVLVLCGILIVAGVATFGFLSGAFRGSPVGAVTIWGTVDPAVMYEPLQTLLQSDNSFEGVQYVQKNPETYTAELVNAIASGQSPDLFLLPQHEIMPFTNKIAVIPWSALSQSTFEDSFIDESNLFLTSQGALALPFMIDPLVLYFNRDMLSAGGYADPPQKWTEFIDIASRITVLDLSKNISKSAVALGTWNNVDNAKAILSALIMQAGDPITGRDENGAPRSVFGEDISSVEKPAESALRFYTQFADPAKTVYSWNRALPRSSEAFSAGQLALYLGFASEYQALQERNPNVRIGVAMLPQGSSNTLTYGTLYGLAISRGAQNPKGALTIAKKLTDPVALALFAEEANLPPVHRQLFATLPNDPILNVFYRSALISKAWFDPNPPVTDVIFQKMVESILSGKYVPADAASEGQQALGDLFRALQQPTSPQLP